MWDVSAQSVATEFPKVYKGQVCEIREEKSEQGEGEEEGGEGEKEKGGEETGRNEECLQPQR
jgi:hypothetical protein